MYQNLRPDNLDQFGSSASSYDDYNTHTTICTQVPGLVNEQRLVCERAPETLPVIGEGARTGIMECKRQFKNERWNCTLEPNAINDIGKVLERGNTRTHPDSYDYTAVTYNIAHIAPGHSIGYFIMDIFIRVPSEYLYICYSAKRSPWWRIPASL